MSSAIINRVTGRVLPLAGDDIDTDRIIPARFMRCVTFDSLGAYAFYDERFDKEEKLKNHPMNSEVYKGASVLLAGSNFGCGSSREHAPQALLRFGIKAIIALSYADIFAGNCISIGVPAVRLEKEIHEQLTKAVLKNPEQNVTIDLEAKSIVFKGVTYECTIDEATQKSFVLGLWDTTSLLSANKDAILTVAGKLPYVNDYV